MLAKACCQLLLLLTTLAFGVSCQRELPSSPGTTGIDAAFASRHLGLSHDAPGSEPTAGRESVGQEEILQFLDSHSTVSSLGEAMELLAQERPTSDGRFAFVTGAHDGDFIVLSAKELAGRRFFPIIRRTRSELIATDGSRTLSAENGRAWLLASARPLTIPVGDGTLEVTPPWASVCCQRPFAASEPAEFRLTNKGTADVIVEPPSTSCSCAVADAWKAAMRIPPGGEASFRVVITSNGASVDRRDVVVTCEDEGRERRHVMLPIYRWEAASMLVVPAHLNLGTVDNQTTIRRDVRLEEVQTDRFSVVSIDVPGIAARTDCRTLPARDGLRAYVVTVAFDPRALMDRTDAKGMLAGEVDIHTTSSLRPLVKVPFSAKGRPEIRDAPAAANGLNVSWTTVGTQEILP